MNDLSATATAAPLHAASDEDLACRVQHGCADSFTELVQRFQPRLMFVLRRRLTQESDAEDVAQKTLLRVYEKIHLYDSQQKFSPWLFTIALRIATDHHRQKTLPTEPTGETASAVADPTPGPEQQVVQREKAQDIWVLAERVLKPDQWTALWLLYGEAQSVKEIAQSLNRTSVSVRVLLYRARKILTPHLSAYANLEGADSTEFAPPTVPQIVRAET